MHKPTITYYIIGTKKSSLKLLIYFLLLFLTIGHLKAQTVAFPSAEGFGKYATGGRGGAVLKVTNLNDSGPGSLREALEASGPRTIVFEVGGTIRLNEPIYIHNGDVTVAGQTAPGDGILIRGSMISIEVSNVIFRYLRFRPGPAASNASDALSITAWSDTVEDIIIDHCSISWADDENLNLRAPSPGSGTIRDITVQNCIISENTYALLSTGKVFNQTFYKNLFAHNRERNIRSGYPTSGTFAFEMINNIIYGYSWATAPSLGAKFTVLNNHYRASSQTIANGAVVEGTTAGQATPSQTYAYVSGNITPNGANEYNSTLNPYIRSTPYADSGINAIDASLVADDIISHVGCSFPNRDAVDNRIITQYINGNGTLASSGTYPIIQGGSAPTDTDNDGMPNYWEINNGLDINDPSDRNIVNPDGYTNLEYYLNWLILGNAVSAGPDTTICEGTSTTLTASGAESYTWSTGETGESITVSPTITTTYTVTGTHSDGSTTTDDVVVAVNALPIADAGLDTTICQGESITLTASGGSDYEWSTGELGSSITVSPDITTVYTVTVSQNGCESVDSITIFVNPAPTADAGPDVTIDEGQTTTLTAAISDSYLWSTGETTQSIDVSPTETTTYTVSVFLGECEDQDDVTVNVVPAANANAGEDVTICQGDETVLTASGGETYQWSTGETTQSITVSPDVETTYTVTAFSGSTSDVDDVTVFVNPNPVADAGNDVTILNGETTTLTASGGESYLWNTGETSQSITVNPSQTTTYTVIALLNGCQDSDDVIVTVEVDANAGDDVTICEGEETTLTATGGDTFLWSTGETTQSIIVSPTTDTNYSVTVSAGSSSDTDDVTVFVNPSPGVYAGEDVSIEEGQSITLTASAEDNAIFQWSTGETTQSITVSPLTTTTYSVTALLNGCQDTDDVTVTVYESAEANAGDDVTICEGEETTLTATGGDTFLWSTGETTQSITVSPIADTNYSVTVSIGNSSDTDDVNVFVNPIPNANVSDDITINEGEQTVLTASGGDSYLWSTEETTQSITVSPTETTTYTVFVSSNGCENFAEVTVSVNPAANAYAGEDQTICEGYSTTLTASGGDSYLWSTGETTQTIEVNPEASTTYTVIVSNNFSSDTDDVTVFVSPNPEVQVSGDVTILDGEFVTLSASGANSYQWSNGATQPNIAVSPSVTTTYSVTGFVNNCSDTDSVVVNVVEQVEAYAGEDINVCYGESIVLTASGGDNYLWNTGETTQSISVSPDEDTLFTVIVSNELDSDAADVMVYVDECEIESIEETDDLFEFSVYTSRMNPNTLIVRMAGLSSESTLLLHDLTGKLIHSEDVEANNGGFVWKQIDTSRYSNGIYLITLLEQDKQTSKQILFH